MRTLVALATLGCYVPATVHDERVIATRTTDKVEPYGPEVLWLDANADGSRILIRAQIAQGCWRDVILDVDEHTHKQAQLKFPEGGLGGMGPNPWAFVFAVGTIFTTMGISYVLTRGFILIDHTDAHRALQQPGEPQQDLCIRPARRLPLHVDIRGERTDVVTDEAGLARIPLLIPTPGHVFISTDGAGTNVLSFDYDPAHPLATSERPEPPPPALP